jgi:uncharacterized protein (PEP-CTERM system associated)
MAKRLRLAPLAAACALLVAGPCHAGWKFTPMIGLTETWTDNVNLQSDQFAHSQLVSEAIPGFTLSADTPRLKLAGSSQWHVFAYSDGSQANTQDHALQYQLDAKALLVRELLYLDANFSGGPQAVSAFGPQFTSDNLYSLGNRSNVRTWRISPYLRERFGASANLLLRYTRDNVDAGSNNAFGTSDSSTVNLDLASGSAWHSLGWGVNYMRQDLDSRIAGSSSAQNANASLRYRLNSHWSVTATRGYDKYDYPAFNERTAGASWTGGFVWAPSQRTLVQAAVGRRYFGKTGSLLASVRSRRSVWSVNYSDDVTTSRQQFVLPATIDTAATLDRLFATSIPDPQARAQAVADYIQSAGLPPSLVNNINYLSNRWMRQKLLQAALAVRGAHGDLLFTVFNNARIALSQRDTDSGLLGSQLLGLNDDTRQVGANATWKYRLSARTDGLARFDVTHNKSISTGLASNNAIVRVGLTHQFDRTLRGALEVRHNAGDFGPGSNQRYRENAISAGLSLLY